MRRLLNGYWDLGHLGLGGARPGKENRMPAITHRQEEHCG
jgi:hypothetical protein